MALPHDPVSVVKRLICHVADGTTDQAPDTMALPVAAYLDEHRYREEFEIIFKRHPQAIALGIQVAEPGNYLASKIMGVPVLIVRGKDAQVRVFLNACRHRGAKVCAEGAGNSSRFTCPYHAWTYNNQGDLIGVTGREKFGPADIADLGLTELHSVECGGVIWATLTPGIPFDIDNWLGDARREIEALALDKCHLFAVHHVPGPGWKVTMDGYLEAYHHDTVHRNTLAKHTIGNTIAHDLFGRHQRLTMGRHSLRTMTSAPADEQEALSHIRQIHCIFPNFQISGILGGHILVSQIFPGGTPDSSMTIQLILSARKPETPEEQAACEDFSLLANDAVAREDYPIGFGIQDGLASGANEHFVLGRNEPGIQHYHRTVERTIGKIA
jgi:phenylpropionate dioxygenase-like ring-hydroxylating dioxygenase large terminal subunit